MNRRETLAGIAGLAIGSCLRAASAEPPFNAAGERVGEVTATSAIVHARLTATPTRNNRGYSFPVHTHNLSTMNQLKHIRMPDKMAVSELEGACAGNSGRARLHYGLDPQLAGALVTPWMEVGPQTDFTHPFDAPASRRSLLARSQVIRSQPYSHSTTGSTDILAPRPAM